MAPYFHRLYYQRISPPTPQAYIIGENYYVDVKCPIVGPGFKGVVMENAITIIDGILTLHNARSCMVMRSRVRPCNARL